MIKMRKSFWLPNYIKCYIYWEYKYTAVLNLEKLNIILFFKCNSMELIGPQIPSCYNKNCMDFIRLQFTILLMYFMGTKLYTEVTEYGKERHFLHLQF